MADELNTNSVDLATELTIAWLSNPNTRVNAEEVPAFLQRMHQAVSGLSSPAQEEPAYEERAEYTPAVSVRKSLASKDHIISMIDGKPYKTLRRHLSRHGLTPEQYRERYNLKSDYPLVSENYSEARRDMAKKIGLGSKGRKSKDSDATSGASAAAPAPRRGRKKADAETA
jgi:predicted transcriptional regulator